MYLYVAVDWALSRQQMVDLLLRLESSVPGRIHDCNFDYISRYLARIRELESFLASGKEKLTECRRSSESPLDEDCDTYDRTGAQAAIEREKSGIAAIKDRVCAGGDFELELGNLGEEELDRILARAQNEPGVLRAKIIHPAYFIGWFGVRTPRCVY
jgi:hypothetical protein